MKLFFIVYALVNNSLEYALLKKSVNSLNGLYVAYIGRVANKISVACYLVPDNIQLVCIPLRKTLPDIYYLGRAHDLVSRSPVRVNFQVIGAGAA